ncbi:MAG: DUF4386 family protein [Chloroflexi bacterium]|nr:DUF4386 family protein [Chloroflexota bacterium]
MAEIAQTDVVTFGDREFASPAPTEPIDAGWRPFFRVGGIVALLTVGVAITEIIVTFFPNGAGEGIVTAADWFALFQADPFMGLRNLGLLNIGFFALGVVVYVALYGALQRVSRGWVTLALITYCVGAAVFFATNRALPMLQLANHHATAATEAQRSALLAAGEAMLAVGQSHTPGTFLAFALAGAAGFMLSLMILRSNIISKASAYIGLVGFSLLLIYDFGASFLSSPPDFILMIALPGGILSMVWYVTVGRSLLALSRDTAPQTSENALLHAQ